jgi:hypothetical protein
MELYNFDFLIAINYSSLKSSSLQPAMDLVRFDEHQWLLGAGLRNVFINSFSFSLSWRSACRTTFRA